MSVTTTTQVKHTAQKIAASGLLPLGAFDTHIHVFDSNIGPYAPGRAYTPAEAPLHKLVAFSRSLTVNAEPCNMVLVQPSPYGTDNTVLLAALQGLQRQQPVAMHRGIAVVDVETVSDAELNYMHAAGIRGIRLNLQAGGHGVDVPVFDKALKKAADRIKHLPGWKVQVFCPGYIWERIYETVMALPVEVIADHVGGLLGPSKLRKPSDVQSPWQQPGFHHLVQLASQGRVWVKISGFYRVSSKTQICYEDMSSIIIELVSKIANRLLWASDWPHTGDGANRVGRDLIKIEPFRSVDDVGILNNLRRWVGPEVWRKMLVDNPTEAYI